MVARSDHYERFVELYNQGKKAPEIALLLGKEVGAIHQMTYRLRGSNVIPPVSTSTGLSAKIGRFRRQTGHKLGTIGQVIEPMDEKILAWMAKEVPVGGTVTDLIRAIIEDAYYEENENV